MSPAKSYLLKKKNAETPLRDFLSISSSMPVLANYLINIPVLLPDLSNRQLTEIQRLNQLYLDNIQHVLQYYHSTKKRIQLMIVWGNWVKQMQHLLTSTQYDVFLSLEHDKLWEEQLIQI